MSPTLSDLKILAWPAFRNRSQNPYNFLLYTALKQAGVGVGECSTRALLRERYAILHIHWPEGVWNTPNLLWATAKGTVLLMWLLIAKARGAKIVWTVHNLRPHEGYHPRVSKVFGSVVLRLMDGFIQLTAVGSREMQKLFPQTSAKQSFVIPHGHYRDISPTILSRVEAREALKVPLSSRVVTFCGAIRRYKNVPALIDAFVEMAGTGDRLLIAGKAEQAEVLEEIVERAGNRPSIAILSKLLSESEIEQYVRAADLVVLPYNNILNSGAAILALSHGRPVLVPALGAMLELQQAVGREWVTTYEGELTAAVLAAALAAACRRDEATSPDLSQLEWDGIARMTVAAYSSLIASEGDCKRERAEESDASKEMTRTI